MGDYSQVGWHRVLIYAWVPLQRGTSLAGGAGAHVVKEDIPDPGNIPSLPIESTFCLPSSRASVGLLSACLAWEILQQGDMRDMFGHVSPKHQSSSGGFM